MFSVILLRITVGFFLSHIAAFVLNLTMPRQYPVFVDWLDDFWRGAMISLVHALPENSSSFIWWAERIFSWFATEIGGQDFISLFIIILVYWVFEIPGTISKIGSKS